MNILRRRRVVLALLVLILGCKLGRQAEAKPPNPPPGYMAIPSPAAAQPNAAPVLEREALALAASHWNGLYILCGDDRFTQRFVEHGHGDIYGYQWMTEYKGVSWVILPGEVTEADRLNGIEWQGTSEVHGIATRRQLRNQGWQPWQQFSKYLPMGRISLTKSGGQWHIQQEAGGYDDGETVALSCGDQRQLSDPQQQAAAIRGEQAAQQTFVAHWQTSNGNVELTNSKWTNNSNAVMQSATLECDQLAADGTNLAQDKTTLNGPVQAGGTAAFNPFQMGTVSQYMSKVNCTIVAVTPAN